MTLALALLPLALAADIDLAQAPVVGDGPQSITVVLTDLPGHVRPEVQHLGLGLSVDARGIGQDARAGTIRGEPRRFAHIQVVDKAKTPPAVLYSGLAVLPDQNREVMAFKYREWTDGRGQPQQMLTRVPLVPYTRVEFARDEVPVVLIGGVWATLALLYAVAMAVLFTLKRREG
ncbi:MAG: hypothetical protein H6739_32730 [Alphaproteobacteria bacterium]|nr:hypothetical protein [Alphaproteobacteria bacterium]